MKIDYKIFGVVSVLLLIVLAVSPMKDRYREWRSYQQDYNKIIKKYPDRIEPVEIGIKQIWVEELNRVDRCITCHVGMSTENFENAEEPFSTHPKMYHDVFEFGCTICHRGQGPATTNDESKGRTKYWDDPMLTGNYLEATCGICHKTSDVPEAPVLTQGRQLTIDYNCNACHNYYSYNTVKVTTLDGIGDKTSRKWLTHWLKTPKQFQPKTKMPTFNFSDEEINILSDFMLAFHTYPGEAILDELPPALNNETGIDEVLAANGKKIFMEAQCISCHLVNDTGGYLARDIGKIASKAKAEWIYNYVKNPRLFQHDVEMPQYNFSKEQLTAITAYMLTEFIDWDEPEEEAVPASEGIQTFTDTGDDICTEDGKPVIRMYSTTICPHCKWIMETFDSLVKEYVDEGKIVAHHYELNTGDDTLTHEVEEYVPQSEREVYREYNPDSTVPTFVFGCKYTRVGNSFEQSADGLEKEEAEFRAVIEELLA